ncbi:MAG: tetratricopeptide repeat protein, partial [Bryobacteraceae bacterium]
MEIQATATEGEKSLLDRAGEAYQAKDHDQALLLLDQAIQDEPEGAAPWLYKGLIHSDRSEFAQALAAFDRAAELDPSATDDEIFLFRRGVALGEVGRHAEALESLERALERMTDQSPLRELRGVAMFRIGWTLAAQEKLAEADEYLRQALELWPPGLPRANALRQRSLVLVQLDRFQDCLATLEELFRLDPDAESNIQLWALHRSSLMGLGRLEEAKAEPPEALKDHPFTLATRGSALTLLGRLEDAAPLLAKAGEPGPQYDGDFLAWLGAGMANVGLARAEKALAALDRARAIQPTAERVTVSMMRGLALSWLGRTKEAMEEVRDLPPLDFVVLIRGTALAESGDVEG